METDIQRLKGKIAAIESKITIENKCRLAAENMLSKLSDKNTIQQCKITITESSKRLQFLNSELSRLSTTLSDIYTNNPTIHRPSGAEINSLSDRNVESADDSNPSEHFNAPFINTAPKRFSASALRSPTEPSLVSEIPRRSTAHPSVFVSLFNTLRVRNKSQSSLHGANSSSKAIDSFPEHTFKPKESATLFDFWRMNCPLSTEKINFKANEIKFKLVSESKVVAGLEKILSGPVSSEKSNIEKKFQDCRIKVSILQKALLKYEGLQVSDDQFYSPLMRDPSSEALQANLSIVGPGTPSTFTGKFKMKLKSSHGIPGKHMPNSFIYVVFTVDGSQKAQSKSTSGNWNEDIVIYVENANDIEIAVYESGGYCLALLWFSFSVLINELIETGRLANPESKSMASSETSHKPIPKQNMDAVLEMEPSGIISIGFSLESIVEEKSNYQKSVVRRRPVQKIFLNRGHKFVPKQFYQVVKCAICNEFLISGKGYRCISCKYLCHKKCQSRVLTSCVEKQADEKEGENDLISAVKHRIPHRFELAQNITVAWCCHCGTIMTSLSKRRSYRCNECGATCHEDCAPLVPHFCGLSAELIDQVRYALEATEKMRKSRLESVNSPPALDRQLTEPKNLRQIFTRNNSSKTASRPDRIESLKQFGTGPKGIGLDDFNLLAVLGKGNFGKVMLAEERSTKMLYAIKILKKDFIVENDEVESTKCEKRIFMTANLERHPFLVNLHSCFQTESRLYFVMEYVAGGDLMWHIQHQQFSERRARFYAAEILLALEYFHKHNIVYRDLKLDNILLTIGGHIKIADYGLCKENMGYGAQTATFCGTPEFMAPDILSEKPYTRAVDWWAYGILIYEMLLGQSPFKGGDEDEIFNSILYDEILYPVNLPRDAISLLKQLLVKNPKKRLGSGPTDSEEIKKHEFFQGMDWNLLLEQRLEPPFFPTITSSTDVSNFDAEFTRELPVLTPCNSILSDVNQEEFRGFTYISDWAYKLREQE